MDAYGIQVSIKTANDTMINVRGEDLTEFDVNLAHALEKVEEIHAAEAAFKRLPPQGLDLLKDKLGAEPIGEYDTAAGPPPGGFQQTHCDRCKESPTCKNCGRACVIPPKQVKEWFVHDCPSGDRSHKGAWCNLPK